MIFLYIIILLALTVHLVNSLVNNTFPYPNSVIAILEYKYSE